MEQLPPSSTREEEERLASFSLPLIIVPSHTPTFVECITSVTSFWIRVSPRREEEKKRNGEIPTGGTREGERKRDGTAKLHFSLFIFKRPKRRNPPVGSSHPQRIFRVCKLRGCSCNAAITEEGAAANGLRGGRRGRRRMEVTKRPRKGVAFVRSRQLTADRIKPGGVFGLLGRADTRS